MVCVCAILGRPRGRAGKQAGRRPAERLRRRSNSCCTEWPSEEAKWPQMTPGRILSHSQRHCARMPMAHFRQRARARACSPPLPRRPRAGGSAGRICAARRPAQASRHGRDGRFGAARRAWRRAGLRARIRAGEEFASAHRDSLGRPGPSRTNCEPAQKLGHWRWRPPRALVTLPAGPFVATIATHRLAFCERTRAPAKTYTQTAASFYWRRPAGRPARLQLLAKSEKFPHFTFFCRTRRSPCLWFPFVCCARVWLRDGHQVLPNA